ncbi:MAG: LLM class F420-dependent oxidoreductase [Acetobacteraceae bacterium]
MQFGFSLPVRGELANHDGIVAIARAGERLGFASATMADHVVFPTVSDSHYPYDASGRHPSTGDALEPMTLLSFVAGQTTTLRLVTSVLILPYRNPVLTAKMVSTIDVLSRGRITLGVGVGWLREEFEALDAPDFAQRGSVSDEYIEIFKKLWSPGPVQHHGRHYSFGPLHAEPLPVQQPHPPIWVGGHSRAAIRRTARHADGWHPLGTVDTAELRPAEFSRMLDTLKREAEAAGRDHRDVAISFVARLRETAQPIAADDRMPFSGSAGQIIADTETYRGLGVTHLSFDFRRPTLAETLARMEWFAREVMPATRR